MSVKTRARDAKRFRRTEGGVCLINQAMIDNWPSGMKVLFVASECAPFVKTGGLADVIGAVPKTLAERGVAVRVMLPAYPALAPIVKSGKTILKIKTCMAARRG